MENANDLVTYMNESILTEFKSFAKGGTEYREKANHIESVVVDFTERMDRLQNTIWELPVRRTAHRPCSRIWRALRSIWMTIRQSP